MFWIVMGFIFVLSMGLVGILIKYTEAQEEIKKIGWKQYKKELITKFIVCLILAIITTMILLFINEYMFWIPPIDIQLNPCHYPNMTGAQC